MELTEKKQNEKAIAELFLRLYNERRGASFIILELRETPDVVCKDSITGKILELEISELENLPGDIAYGHGRAQKPMSPTTKTNVVALFADVVPNYRKRLESKLLSSYGSKTALVLKQHSILWESRQWEGIARSFLEDVLRGKEGNYGAGIWVICTDNGPWPPTFTLFCLSQPTAP